ncbi:hypothetical protein Athena1_0020 [Vibrio phage Athena1]|nr:hypothetical protein Athena1_0020 [Vibrio phage Athena1]
MKKSYCEQYPYFRAMIYWNWRGIDFEDAYYLVKGCFR